MKFRGNSESIPRLRETVAFEEVEMCALDEAFENPANADALKEMRMYFPDTYTESKTKFFKDSPRMSFGKDEFRAFLSEMRVVVDSEKARLARSPDKSVLSCGHRASHHMLALDSISNKIN